VAKAIRDYSRTNPLLVIKGTVLGGKVLDAKSTAALADLPSREVLLAQFAGALQAPLAKFAGLLQALPRNFAYGLKALIDQQGGVPAAADEPAADEPATEPVAESPAPDATAEPPADAAVETPETTETTDAAGEPLAESPASDATAEPAETETQE
jgi:large subunit ribosomal protein L10